MTKHATPEQIARCMLLDITVCRPGNCFYVYKGSEDKPIWLDHKRNWTAVPFKTVQEAIDAAVLMLTGNGNEGWSWREYY